MRECCSGVSSRVFGRCGEALDITATKVHRIRLREETPIAAMRAGSAPGRKAEYPILAPAARTVEKSRRSTAAPATRRRTRPASPLRSESAELSARWADDAGQA